MKINMETKFDLGQEVYIIQKARARVRYKNQKKEKLEKIRRNERY